MRVLLCTYILLLKHGYLQVAKNNFNNLQAFQLIVFARYLLGVPKP
jgi:hypothetical protein